MFESAGLPHLKIDRTAVEGARRKSAGFGGDRKFGDRKKHADDIHDDVDFIFEDLGQAQPSALGIDPRLILVVEIVPETVGPADDGDWDNSGLRIVEARESKKVVAFSDDPEMTEFLRRLDVYSAGPQNGKKTATYEAFFDKIVNVRRYGREDRLGAALSRELAEADSTQNLTVDVDVWHPGDQDVADQWVSLLTDALQRFGAEVHDSFSSSSAGVSLMRVTAARDIVSQLLNVDLVAKVESLPGKISVNFSPSEIGVEDLSAVPASGEDVPVVGMIDSGVQIEHPLLRGCVLEAASVSDLIVDGFDRHGHGTAVASVLLRGPLGNQLATGEWEEPLCKVLSVRVLDSDNRIPPHRLPQSEIRDAVAFIAERGVKVINLSLGDLNGMMVDNRAPTIAAVLDTLARQYGVVFVVPTGTVVPKEYSGLIDADFRKDYPYRMLESPVSGLIDPAPAAIALTVAGSVPELNPVPLGTAAVGKPGWPSPFSRIGPGINGAIKPELSAPAGTLGQSLDDSRLQDVDALKMAVADGRPGAQGVVTYDLGTSLAAPQVARICAAVQRQYPTAGANMTRALVLQSVSERVPPLEGDRGLTDSDRETKSLRLTGYGEVSERRSVLSSDRDTVLFAQEEIPLDEVHLYTVPIPESFFTGGRAERGVSVSLCYDPPVRARRMDYMASRMQFELLRGVSAEKVIDLLLAEEKAAKEVREHAGAKLPTLSSLKAQERVSLRPSRRMRSAGANQLGRYVWRKALKKFNENSSEFVLAVQSVNRWDTPGAVQPYAVAIRLWVDEKLPPIYADLRTRIQAMRAQAIVRAQARA
ncbi:MULTISPECIES: S8 family peptidase [Streptomyces]|uniref:S8 family peptidase n=1 Tax=Streptomyces TaxID=1883 RepID=UPI0036F8BE57